MERYAEALETDGVRTHLLPGRRSKWFADGRWHDVEPALATLVIGGSWFVAVRFEELTATNPDSS